LKAQNITINNTININITSIFVNRKKYVCKKIKPEKIKTYHEHNLRFSKSYSICCVIIYQSTDFHSVLCYCDDFGRKEMSIWINLLLRQYYILDELESMGRNRISTTYDNNNNINSLQCKLHTRQY